MRMIATAIVLASAFVGTVAQAQTPRSDLAQACSQEARRQSLSGDALTEFMNRCWAGQVAVPSVMNPPQSCEDQARTLSGEDKVRFVRDCNARSPAAAPMPQSCEDQARTLSGEDKARFMRNCTARK
ncbi:PsiF family protein [Vineibacter terrae]|uniref:PsiF family protein n=1 Tax=Vineibacter terrae TaxID=2586908 RepID=UPI002E32CCB7|nr:PsiF family protein [Vineibacter terrae]HEX2889484.1 PsiF family protein [Vineibacter terrae]